MLNHALSGSPSFGFRKYCVIAKIEPVEANQRIGQCAKADLFPSCLSRTILPYACELYGYAKPSLSCARSVLAAYNPRVLRFGHKVDTMSFGVVVAYGARAERG